MPSQDAQHYFEQAKRKLRNGDTKASLHDLDEAVKHDPDNYEYYLARADQRFRLDYYEAAIEDFTKIIENSQDLEDLRVAHSYRALCYESLGHTNELLADMG